MRRKELIELFFYAIIVIVGVILLLSQKPEKKHYKVTPDFSISVERRGDDAIVPLQ